MINVLFVLILAQYKRHYLFRQSLVAEQAKLTRLAEKGMFKLTKLFYYSVCNKPHVFTFLYVFLNNYKFSLHLELAVISQCSFYFTNSYQFFIVTTKSTIKRDFIKNINDRKFEKHSCMIPFL